MRFGHHGNAEYSVALLANEGRKSHVFATDGDYGLVAEFEAGEVGFGVGVEAQNLVACEFEFADE